MIINPDELRRLLEAGGQSMREVSLKAGLGETGLKDLLRRKGVDPKVSTMSRLARHFRVPIEQLLLGQADDFEISSAPRSAGGAGADLPVRGNLQTGAWVAVRDEEDGELVRPAPVDRRFPAAAQWLSQVRCDGMDALTKGRVQAGLIEGDLVLVVDAVRTGYQPRTGDLIEVERTRTVDGVRERELSLRQVEVTPEGVKLWSRSHNPRWRDPLTLPVAGGETEIHTRGRVLQALRDY